MDKEKLAQLLQASQVPNTEQLAAVTAELQKNYYSKSESLLLLSQIAVEHGDGAIQQLAAVQASRLVVKHWQRTPPEQKPNVRMQLLKGALNDSSSTARHAVGRLVASVASADMDDGDEEYLKQLLPLNNAVNVDERGAGSFILCAMLETEPAHFVQYVHQILDLFKSRIVDESREVQINVVQAIGAILMIADPDEDNYTLEALQGYLPCMVNILKAAVDAGDDEKYGIVFEVLHSYLGCDSALLSPHLRDLLQFMIDLSSNPDAEDDVRSQALGFLTQCVRYRRMKIQGMKDMGAQLMVKAMHVVTSLDVDEDDDDVTPARTAISLINALANELPPRQVIVPLLDQFSPFASNENPAFRMAAMLALGNAAEGAPDFFSTQLDKLLPVIVHLLLDSSDVVRHASLVGLIHLAEEMADEMASHHEPLINAVLKNLEAASEGERTKLNASIIKSACGALDSFGDAVENQIMSQHGPNLIRPMIKLLDHDDFGVKASAASAIGAIASSMNQSFLPYFEDVMKALAKFVMAKDSDEAMRIRSSTCDSLGRIAMAVGAEAFQPYVMDLMRASEEALSLDNPRLKETSFILWSNLSKIYKEQFNPFLDGVFKGLFASLELQDEELNLDGIDTSQLSDGALIVGGKRYTVKSSEKNETNASENSSGIADDSFLENMEDGALDDGEDLEQLGTVTALALEQEIALDALGDVITNCCDSSNLETYAEQVVNQATTFAEHAYEGCRRTAISTLWRTYARVYQVWIQSAGLQWQPGMPPNPTPPPSIIKIGQILYNATMTNWTEDAERTVITDVNRNVAATLRACGSAILASEETMLKEVVSVVGLMLTRSHPCQQDLGDEEEEREVDSGSSEYDWLVIDTALDVVVGLAAALGPAFGELWKVFEKPVLKLASSTEDLHRSTGAGTIAEIIKYTGDGITPFTESLGQALGRRLSDPDSLAKSNAAYAMGMLILKSNDVGRTIPLYPQLWEKLEPLLSQKEARTTDNAAGCLARMMLKHPDDDFVSQALPAVVAVLPLKEDFEENEPVYRCIYNLYSRSNQTVEHLTPHLITIFEKVMGPPEEQLEPETRLLLQKTVQILHIAKPELLANAQGLLRLAGVEQ